MAFYDILVELLRWHLEGKNQCLGSDLCWQRGRGDRAVFRSLFPIPEIINILMRLSFHSTAKEEENAGSLLEIEVSIITSLADAPCFWFIAQQNCETAVGWASSDNRNSIKLLASGFLCPWRERMVAGTVSVRDLMRWKIEPHRRTRPEKGNTVFRSVPIIK